LRIGVAYILEIKVKYGLACVNKFKNLCMHNARLSATAALCAVLTGCVSSDHSALSLAEQPPQQSIATPQLAVVAGDPSLSNTAQQSSDPNAAAVSEQSRTLVQAPNAPQISPIKRQTASTTPTGSSSQLAIAEQPTNVDPAVQQVANIAESATTTTPSAPTQQSNETDTGVASDAATSGEPAIIAAVPPAPQEIKKPSLLERLFGGRARKEPATPQPVIAQTQQTPINTELEQNTQVTLPATETQVANEPAEQVTSDQGAAPATDNIVPAVEDTATEQNKNTVVAALPANETTTREPSVLARLFNNTRSATASRSSNLDDRFASASSSSRDEDSVGRSNLRNRFASPQRKRPSKIKTITRGANAETRVLNTGSRSALPGVKSNNEIFGIEEDPQVKGNKANTRVAALGNFGRLSPNGLRLQHDKVQVACLKPGVLRMVAQVERHYGKKPIITSGYRSPKRNRRAGGARNSQHVFCKAVDMQVEGVSKWQLAKYLRSIPGRGGVGTYCRTKSVHIDIGKKRDWHHPCRRSAKRKRKKA